MSEGRKGVRELGPVWINAISALTGALVAGSSLFFVGKASTAETAGSSARTTTVTVTAAPDDRSSDGIYWSGDLVWGTHDLDTRPPSDQAGFWHDDNFAEGVMRAGSTGILRIWSENFTPDKGDCVAAIAEGSSEIRGIKAGSYVCGRTAAGRPFRIQVFGAGRAEVSGHVTVWGR